MYKKRRQATDKAAYPVVFVNCTCAQGEGVIPHFIEVTVYAVQAELPFITVVTAALSITSSSSVTVAHSISMTGSLRASNTCFKLNQTEDG